jgi:hypothetical protein
VHACCEEALQTGALAAQEWLMQHGRSEADVTSIREGFRSALGKETLAVLNFRDFALTFSWFASTLQLMAGPDERAAAALGLPRVSSLSSAPSLQLRGDTSAAGRGDPPQAGGDLPHGNGTLAHRGVADGSADESSAMPNAENEV